MLSCDLGICQISKALLQVQKLHALVLYVGQLVCQDPFAAQRIHPLPQGLQAGCFAAGHPLRQVAELPPQLHLIRHRDLRGVGGRGGPGVRHKVGNGDVWLMAYGGDHRGLAGVDGAGHPLIVEGPQVLHRAAAPAGDDDIADFPFVGVPDGPRNLRRGLRSLHPHRQQDHLG